MGGRSSASGKIKQKYESRVRGQISKMQAGLLYKSVKNGDVKALPETTRLFYNESDAYIRFASERYSQDHLFYDRSDNLTTHLMNKDYRKAQKVINDIESDLIRRAGKKSAYYKYKK